MSVTDFLFEGQAPPPATLTGTATSQLPEWYNEYTRNMLGRAQAIADIPYATYGGPRIAGFTPTEQAGMAATQTAAGAYKPFISSAEQLFGRSAGISPTGMAQPFVGEAADITRAAAGASTLPLAQMYYGQAIQQGGLGAAQPFMGRAAEMSAAGAAAPGFGTAERAVTRAGEAAAVPLAQQYIERGLGESPLTAAQPYLAGASRTFPQAAAEYMSPYTQGVVGQIADLGLRQLQEKFLPAIGEEFTKAGQFGGSRMGEFGARALRDVGEAVLSEQAKALESGYKTAADIYGTDVSRMADLARISGGLGAQDVQSLMGLAGKYGELGEAAQTLGLRGAEAVTGVGAAERALQQQNLNLAYQDFLRQQGYPAEQAKFLSGMLGGVRLPEVKIEQTTEMPAMPGDPSGIAKGVAGFKGIFELYDLLKKYFPPK